MKRLRTYSGLFVILVFTVVSLISTTLAPDTIKDSEYVLSDFGATAETAIIFNSGLVLMGVLLLVFLLEFKDKIHVPFENSFVYYPPGIFLILTGLISLDVSESFHFVVFMLFNFTWILMVLYTILFTTIKHEVQTRNLLLWILVPTLLIMLGFFINGGEYWIWGEYTIGLSIFFYILIFTDYIIFHKDKKRLFSFLPFFK